MTMENITEAAGERITGSLVKAMAAFIVRHRFVASALMMLIIGLLCDFLMREAMNAHDEAQTTRTQVSVQAEQMKAASENINGMTGHLSSIDTHLNNVDTHLNNLDADGMNTRSLLGRLTDAVDSLNKHMAAAPRQPTAAARVP